MAVVLEPAILEVAAVGVPGHAVRLLVVGCRHVSEAEVRRRRRALIGAADARLAAAVCLDLVR